MDGWKDIHGDGAGHILIYCMLPNPCCPSAEFSTELGLIFSIGGLYYFLSCGSWDDWLVGSWIGVMDGIPLGFSEGYPLGIVNGSSLGLFLGNLLESPVGSLDASLFFCALHYWWSHRCFSGSRARNVNFIPYCALGSALGKCLNRVHCSSTFYGNCPAHVL